MRKKTLNLVLAGCVIMFLSGVASAMDCAGHWRVIPGYNPGMGAPCQHLGLNTHVGTCHPGDAFETLCDDAPGGRYKICQGPRPCQVGGAGAFPPPQKLERNLPPCSGWDYIYNRPCPPGYVNRDCRGGCER
jgi:hypothetical protein